MKELKSHNQKLGARSGVPSDICPCQWTKTALARLPASPHAKRISQLRVFQSRLVSKCLLTMVSAGALKLSPKFCDSFSLSSFFFFSRIRPCCYFFPQIVSFTTQWLLCLKGKLRHSTMHGVDLNTQHFMKLGNSGSQVIDMFHSEGKARRRLSWKELRSEAKIFDRLQSHSLLHRFCRTVPIW